MSKKVKKSKKTKKNKKPTKVVAQKLNGNYLKYNGSLYEKLDLPGEQVDLDLDLDLLDFIKSDLSNKNCLSIAEYIRMVLRTKLHELESNITTEELDSLPDDINT